MNLKQKKIFSLTYLKCSLFVVVDPYFNHHPVHLIGKKPIPQEDILKNEGKPNSRDFIAKLFRGPTLMER